MGYGHAERNLALIGQLEAETRELLGTLDQPDPEQSARLQEVISPERHAVHQRRRDKHLSHSADRARSLLPSGVLIPIAAGNITRATIAFTIAGLPGGLAGERQTAVSSAMRGYKKMGKAKDIREAVGAELDFDPLVDAAGITVKNMNGQVALNGMVPSYPQYLEAAAAAQRVAGVTDVHNHLEVVLPDGDYRDDAMLTAAANNALTLNVTVPAGIEATARDGNLTLTGIVQYGPQRTAAEAAVAGLTGVRNVKDDIEIAWDADPFDVSLLVQDALDRYALIPDDSDVAMDTHGNTVTLAGHVRTWAEHDAVIGAAWMAGGVFEVRDDLYVTG